MQSTQEFLLNIIPTTVVDAFAKGEILQVLLVAVLFGFCLHKFGGRGTLVFDMIEKTSHVLFSIVGVIMKVAPIGAFGAMAVHDREVRRRLAPVAREADGHVLS
jgi:aerobic C4-dicarboxylate transport protein